MRDNKSIEGLRVVLFLFIFLFHAYGNMFPLGWIGIDVFLVITAYFLTKKLLKQEANQINIKQLLIKRAYRLYPPYIVVVVGMTVLYFITKKQIPGDFFSYFLFAQNFQWEFVPSCTTVPGCGHLWYLNLDFYLVVIWLFILKFTPKNELRFVFILTIFISVVYRSVCAIYANSLTLSYTMPWGMLDTFSVGGLLAISKRKMSRSTPYIFLLMGVFGIIGCFYLTSKIYGSNVIDSVVLYKSAGGYAGNPFTIQIHLALVFISFFVVWFCISDRKKMGILSNSKLSSWGG